MGTEIDKTEFRDESWFEFFSRLEDETQLIGQKFSEGKCSERAAMGGFEIEAWLTDREMNPMPLNMEFLKQLDSDLATMELAKFNYELNNTPHRLCGDVFSKFADEMHQTCGEANATARDMGLRSVTIGILPTVKSSDFCLGTMSWMKRYRALNKQIFKERFGRPVELDIIGDKEELKLQHKSVMLEAAATSFQIHTQVPFGEAHHYYNASILASAAMVAVSANSPFLFGKQLWHETRIPLFEQSVDTGEGQSRVSFGSGFLKDSILECFRENIEAYDILLPILFDEDTEEFAHLRLHNGTIWRWNRPLVGFDSDGTLHFRVEHRVMAAGPSLVDMLANAVFYFGVMEILSREYSRAKFTSSFAEAEDNFYRAARYGLDASTLWEGESVAIKRLILDTLLPMAKQGLKKLGINTVQSDYYLGIIGERTASGQNGAAWQLAYVKQYGRDMQKMSDAYWHHQQTGKPVHKWEVK
ncbi:MAG: glutamate-cysteine ligase family protein [Campylobacterota bacterium]|nr:glutamate-cysteine ligase family protein [Campylobacterota bacterium]